MYANRSAKPHADDHTTADIKSILRRYTRTRRPDPRLKQGRQRRRLSFLDQGLGKPPAILRGRTCTDKLCSAYLLTHNHNTAEDRPYIDQIL